MTLERLQTDWDEIGKHDALWGILSSGEKKGGRWNIAEFFQTGVVEVKALIDRLGELDIRIERANALDFGCGVGRLTQAMADYFSHCYGVDISPSMIGLANAYNRHGDRCRYIVNSADDLAVFTSDFFDFIYSTLVLQHMKKPYIKRYIAEFIRTLRPGGILVFQVVCYLPLRYRLQPRRRLHSLLRRLGFPERFLFYRLNLTPIRMTAISEDEIADLIDAQGGMILKVDSSKLDSGIISSVYFVAKRVRR